MDYNYHDNKNYESTYKSFSDYQLEEITENIYGERYELAEMSEITMPSFDQSDFDPKYRSIYATEADIFTSVSKNQSTSLYSKYEYETPSFHSHGGMTVQGPPSLFKKEERNTFSLPFIEITPMKSYTIAMESSSLSSNITVPEKPFYLGPAQFITTLCLVELVSSITQKLDGYFEVSYNFFPDQCRWEIVFLRGSSHSKFEINIYKENSSSFLVEGNRLSGDSSSFHNVYCDIQSSLTHKKTTKKNRSLECFPLPATEQLSMDDAISAMKPILSMATAEQLESRVEGAKMLCDISLQPDLQSTLIEAGGIDVLMDLILIDFCSCNQYAMCALANLSSSRSCQEILIKGPKFLQTLVSMIADGPYHTAEMRRECARTFANLCSGASNGRKIISSIGVDSASSWISSVDNLRDERLKLHARRAKMQIEACM